MQTAFSQSVAARAFLNRFAVAFTTFDGNQVADLFAMPGFALRWDGAIVALTVREDVGAVLPRRPGSLPQ